MAGTGGLGMSCPLVDGGVEVPRPALQSDFSAGEIRYGCRVGLAFLFDAALGEWSRMPGHNVYTVAKVTGRMEQVNASIVI